MLTLDLLLLKFATGLYSLGLLTAILSPRRKRYRLFLLPAVAANGGVAVIRYFEAWPMLPMYLAPVALTPVLGIMALWIDRQEQGHSGGRAGRIILTLTWLIALLTLFFPKDFYLPFIKSQSWAAHLFFILGVAGRACFLVSAAWALVDLLPGRHFRPIVDSSIGPFGYRSGAPSTDWSNRRMNESTKLWAVWGFIFWTLSMFAGELWSYLGWGTPVVWDDPAITTAMATWFFYICLLHLHLTGTWSERGRTVYAAAGAAVVLILNCFPELGPYRWPL